MATYTVFHNLCPRVNVMQAVYLTRAALPLLTASQGSIVAISSGTGKVSLRLSLKLFLEEKNASLPLRNKKRPMNVAELVWLLQDSNPLLRF